MRPLRVAVLSPHIPHAGVDHAGARFLRDWVSALSRRGASITVVAPADSRAVAADADPWTTIEVPVSVPDGRLSKLRHLLRFGPPDAVIDAYRRVADLPGLLSTSDVIEVHWTDWLAVEDAVSRHGRPVVTFAYEVLADVKARQAEGAERLSSRAIAKLQRPALARAELAALARCARVHTVSERDSILLRESGLSVPIRRLSPRLDEATRGLGPSPDETVLFIGRNDRPENIQAIRWLFDDLWPRIRAQRPTARLVIAGAGGGDWLRSDPANGVEVTGRIDDLSVVYRDARVAVAPLRRGSGLKFKVAQALIAGLPVVTTDVGADGFVELGGREYFATVTNDENDFAGAVVALLADFNRCREIGDAAAKWAMTAFDFDAGVDETVAWYETLAR